MAFGSCARFGLQGEFSVKNVNFMRLEELLNRASYRSEFPDPVALFGGRTGV